MTKTVTALVPRSKNKVQIYLNGKYGFSLSKKLAREVDVDQALSEARIQELIELNRRDGAYEQALRLISYRPRSERELRIRFARKGLPEQTQDAAVQQLKTEGLIDDAAFARMWIENRMEFRPRGAWALRSELRGKGVSHDEIEMALEDFDEGEAARRAAQEGARRYMQLSPDLFRRRLSAYLSRRGFSYPIIAPLIEQHLTELESEREGQT